VEYPKTENLYARDPETHKVGPEYGFRQPEVGLISRWLVTEKVDGMNMRVVWRPYPVSEESDPNGELLFFGRTDRANIPGDLRAHMQAAFTDAQMREVFSIVKAGDASLTYPDEVILFGEGYGPGIQKAGQAYGGEKRFILFDVVVNGTWLQWEDVLDVGCALGVPTVPVLCESCTLEEAKTIVAETWSNLLNSSEHVEGIVARTEPPLFDRRGKRIGFKYKVRDL
jgi:hypothetical protein